MNPIRTALNASSTAAVMEPSDDSSVGRSEPIRTLQLGMSRFVERPGGLERYFDELLQHLPEVGVESRGLVMGESSETGNEAGSVTTVAHERAKLWKRWSGMRRHVAAELGRDRFNLIVAHHSLYSFPIMRMVRRVPVVVHFHGPYAAESAVESPRVLANALKFRMEKAVYSRAARCITLSKAFAKILSEDYGVAQQKIQVIPGGVETDRFDPLGSRVEAREQLGWPRDRPIVLCVRRLVRRMGLENLITSVKAIRERIPDILLYIGGNGGLADELRQLIASHNLEHHVQLLGFIPDGDLPFAYRAADLTVMPTVRLEGFGLAAVESLAAGTPAMVTPVGGLPEAVGSLSPDLIMRDFTPEAVAESLSAALGGQLELPTAQQCRSFARAHFDWSVIVPKVRDVYLDAIDTRKNDTRKKQGS